MVQLQILLLGLRCKTRMNLFGLNNLRVWSVLRSILVEVPVQQGTESPKHPQAA
jgi:hypothetical protein